MDFSKFESRLAIENPIILCDPDKELSVAIRTGFSFWRILSQNSGEPSLLKIKILDLFDHVSREGQAKTRPEDGVYEQTNRMYSETISQTSVRKSMIKSIWWRVVDHLFAWSKRCRTMFREAKNRNRRSLKTDKVTTGESLTRSERNQIWAQPQSRRSTIEQLCDWLQNGRVTLFEGTQIVYVPLYNCG